MSVIYSTVCEVLGGRAETADDRQFLDSAAIIPAVIPLQRYYRRCITVTVVVPYTQYRPRGITVKFYPSHGNYRGYRGITAFPITVSFSSRELVKSHLIILHILYPGKPKPRSPSITSFSFRCVSKIHTTPPCT